MPDMAWIKRETMQKKWIDFHSHALPAMDDGSSSIEESLKMFRREAKQGVGVVVATPHFYADRDRPEAFFRRRDSAERAMRQIWGTDLPRVALGAEVAYFSGMKTCAELKELCIRGTNLLLIEMPFCHWTEEMTGEVIFLQSQRGFQILLAHVERYLGFRNAGALVQLEAAGIRFQVNTGSFLHWQTRGRMLRMLKKGMLPVLGSDCHNLTTRPPNFGLAIQYIEKKCSVDTVRQLRKNSEKLLYGTEGKQRRSI